MFIKFYILVFWNDDLISWKEEEFFFFGLNDECIEWRSVKSQKDKARKVILVVRVWDIIIILMIKHSTTSI